jgi:copper chaperone CopZ
MCDSETDCACSTVAPSTSAVPVARVQTVYSVTGMTCGGCASRVRDGVAAVPGVSDVSVDVQAGTVTVASDDPVDEAVVGAAVAEAGYQLAR